MTTSDTSGNSTGTAVWTAPRLAVLTILALLAQVVVGVATGLWVEVPESGNAWSGASPQWLLQFHMVIGILLVVLAGWLLVRAGRDRDRHWTAAGLVGLVAIVTGALCGVLFMGTNGDDAASFAMTLGCAVAIAAYTLPLARRPV